MTKATSRVLWGQVACLALWPGGGLAEEPNRAANLRPRADHARNVSSCRNALASCDPSRLTDAEAIALAVASHDRNVSNCVSGFGACDRSRLTAAEARDAAVAGRERRLVDCRDGVGECDHESLTRAEAREVTLGRRRGNLLACMNEWEDCDRSMLGRQEAAEVDVAVHARNLAECQGGGERCDFSLLSPSEAAALAAAEHPAQLRRMPGRARLLRPRTPDASGGGDYPSRTRGRLFDRGAAVRAPTADRLGAWVRVVGLVALAALGWAVLAPGSVFWTAVLAAWMVGAAIATALLVRDREVPSLAQVIALAQREPPVVPGGEEER